MLTSNFKPIQKRVKGQHLHNSFIVSRVKITSCYIRVQTKQIKPKNGMCERLGTYTLPLKNYDVCVFPFKLIV